MPSRCCSSRSSTRISSRSLASRLESGSSNSSTVGLEHSARASATRCCWPPDSCARGRVGEPAQLHQVERALDLSLRSRPRLCVPHPQREGDVLEHRHVRPDRVALEDHRRGRAARRHVDPAAPSRHRLAAMRMLPRARLLQPGDARSVVVLPQPDGPSSVNCSPGRTGEADAVERASTSP